MNVSMITVAKKELRDIVRDTRSLLVSIIIPLVLFPLIFTAMHYNLKINAENLAHECRICVEGKSRLLVPPISAGNRFTIVQCSNPLKELEKGAVYLILTIPDSTDAIISHGGTVHAEITVDNSRQSSLVAYEILNKVLTDISDKITFNTYPRCAVHPVAISKKTLLPGPEGNGRRTLSLLLPVLLMIFGCTAPMAIAADLCAGEKERKTLEPLLCTPPGRSVILGGKLIALSIMGLCGVFSFFLGIFISYHINPEMFGAESTVFSLPMAHGAILILYALLLVLFFGSVELAVSMYAKTSKEAQIYFIPIVLLAMACGYSAATVDTFTAGTLYRHIPLLNISIIIKELGAGILLPGAIVTTTLWTLLYISIAFYTAKKLFSSELVLIRS